MTIRHLTRWEEFQVWLELERTQLGMDLVTYYGLCSVCGLVQGYSLGQVIISLL